MGSASGRNWAQANSLSIKLGGFLQAHLRRRCDLPLRANGEGPGTSQLEQIHRSLNNYIALIAISTTILSYKRALSAQEAPVAKRHEQSQPEQGKADGLQPVADQFVYIATREVYGMDMDTEEFLCEDHAILEDANRRLQQSSASIRSK
ncbi:MAG: hypothetical protein L6R42_007895 [Xanthoria sp. 1 TBL-2021]|nr:MAG: hypothetical protein L6R42_007895 [Xanthoria sp. 1 TBL-2021]